ncbi:MAG: ArsA family ATPase [Anaerolineae bacterium]|nr:ArsA family ATPase [Anaerolineae bacterium]
MRILLYTGKGGVGKTSVAAATALRCADLGYRTVVISTDSAHSLADSFDLPLGNEPTPITPRLWGQEIDLLHQMEKYWGKVREYMVALFAWRGMDELQAEETSVLPGMEELASLMQIVYLHDSGQYDAIIVDCAPTGATLQLLAFPEVLRWYIQRIFPIQRQVARVVRPLTKAVSDIPLPDDSFFATIEDLYGQLARMHQMLTDPQLTSVRLVLNPEKMVIKEAQRAFTYLSLYGYATDAVVSNRIIPKTVADGYFAAWKEIQAKYSLMVDEAFSPLPILTVPLFDQEVVGLEMLRKMGAAIYGPDLARESASDPTRLYFAGEVQKVEKSNGNYRLVLPLPLVRKEQIQLTQASDELVIHIGNWKRNLILPRALVGLPVKGARYEGDTLVVIFTGDKK